MATDLQTLLSQPPASFVWSKSRDGTRILGTAPGCAIDVWPSRVEVVALFPPDHPDEAARNAMLFTLILAALRPDWVTAPDWIATQMRMATKASGPYEGVQYSRGVRFLWDRQSSKAMLKVRR